MALLPPQFMDTVVALGVPENRNSVRWVATGFLYGHPVGLSDSHGDSLCAIFLVTNRHVINNRESLIARFNRPTSEESKVYPIQLKNPDGSARWTVHPEPECDVAVIPLNTQLLKDDGMNFRWFRGDDDQVLCISRAKEVQVSEGDGIFVLGFPMGEAGEKRNYTIVRQGSIARIQDMLQGSSKTFLIDASIYPGNSGGPVILKPETAAIAGTTPNNKAYLLGMVSEYLPYEDVAVSKQTGIPRVVFEENSGLGVAIPVDVIRETILLAPTDLKTGERATQLPDQK